MAQTIWYIPTGLDIWNQKIVKAPGHYARGCGPPSGRAADAGRALARPGAGALDGPLQERLDHWMTLVHRGNVIEAYRVFLGLMENPAERKAVLAELVFAGLIDVQDRAFYNRSYTTGHKAFRARATVELGRRSAGTTRTTSSMPARSTSRSARAGTRPTRWPATACRSSSKGRRSRRSPMAAPRPRKRQSSPTTSADRDEAEASSTRVCAARAGLSRAGDRLLLAGKSPRRILDAMQVGAAQVILETQALNFSLPQHCFEYCNTLGWFFDNFEHPQQLKLLYLAASYLNRAAWHQKRIGDGCAASPSSRRRAERMSAPQILERIDAAIDRRSTRRRPSAGPRPISTSGADREPLVQRLALPPAASATTRTTRRSRCACSRTTPRTAAPTATACCSPARTTPRVHRKYGDFLDPARSREGDGRCAGLT